MWIVRLALARPYTMIVMTLLMLIGGEASLRLMSTDIFPTINIPVVRVIWTYSGLPADEFEKRITIYSEYALSSNVNDVKSMESQTIDGVAVIRLFFHRGVKSETAIAQATAVSQAILRRMPAGVQPPILLRYMADSVPLIQLSLSSDSLSKSQLYDYGIFRVRQALAAVPGSNLPAPYGGKIRQLRVELDNHKLQGLSFSPRDVNAAINSQNLMLPSGTARIGALGPDLMLNRFALAFPVYTGGRLESAMHERKALLEAENSGLERNRQLTSQSVRLNYLQTLLARENLEVSLMNLKEAQKNRQLVGSRHKAGVATRFDLMQAETARANGQEQVARSNADWERQQVRLSEVLNAPLETRYELKESLLEQEALYADDLPTLSERALARRPELTQLRARIRAVQEQRNGAESGIKPSFFVSLNYDSLGNPSQLQNGWSLLASLAIPLWDGGLTDARVSELDTRELQLQTDEKRQLQRIGVAVKESYLTLHEAEQRLLAAQASQDSAREAVRVGRLRYEVSAATSLELISAQSSLTAASFSLAEARYRQPSARVAINTALGEKVTR